MNTKKIIKSVSSLLVKVAVIAALVGCGNPEEKVYKHYQGIFRNQNGVQLDLVKSGAQIKIGDKTFTGKAAPLSYAVLVSGKPGYYSKAKDNDPKRLEVFFVVPDASSRRTEGGLIYYRTDVFYMIVDLEQQAPVQAITVTHSRDGEVTLDTENQDVRTNWQIGWLPSPDTYELTRVMNGNKPAESKVKIN